jgi:hypothetical protein
MSDQPPPPSPGASFCGECGAAMPADARFCGSCGAAPTAGAVPGAGDEPTQVGPASAWQGVAPVVERDPTAAITTAVPPVPPPGGPTAPPPGPPPTAAGPAGGPPPPGSKGKGPLVAAVLVVLALLAGGAFFLLGGDDDEGEDVAIEREDEDDEAEDEPEETTTTEAADDETTTTEPPEATSTSVEVGGDPTDQGGDEIAFDRVQDDTGFLVVEVPAEWADRSTAPNGGQAAITASTSLATARSDFSVPAMAFVVVATTPVDHDATIDASIGLANLADACTPGEREDYDDGVFVGRLQVFEDCGGVGTTVVQIAGSNPAGVSISVSIQLTSADSPDIADRIVQTFNTTS